MAARKQRRSTEPYEECPGYVFEQLRVERSCLGYVVADKETRRAAIVDPEAEMVEPMLDFVFEQGLKPCCVIDTHTHADHFFGARELKFKTVAKVVMHEKAPSSTVDLRVEDSDRLWLGEGLPLRFLHTPGHARTSSRSCCRARSSPPTRCSSAPAGAPTCRTGTPRGSTTRSTTYSRACRTGCSSTGPRLRAQGYPTLGEEKESNPKMNFLSEEEFVGYMAKENPGTLTPVYQLVDALQANMA